MSLKKRSKTVDLKSKKLIPKEVPRKQAKDSEHKNRFEQLLDDAVPSVKKK